MSISVPGIGSNLDVNSIVSQLIAVDKQPINKLDSKLASYQAKLSGFGTLKSLLSQFQTAMKSLSAPEKFQSIKTTVADSTIASVSGAAGSTPGTYSLEVMQLAQSQKLNAPGQLSSSTTIGSGMLPTSITFDFGTITKSGPNTFDPATGKYTNATFKQNGPGSKTVTIPPDSQSLSGIRDAINKAGVGVTANIVNDGGASPYRLALSVTASGEANSVRISVAGEPAIASLLSHDPANNNGQGLSETVPAQSALVNIDGIKLSRTTNTVSDAIAGATLSLTKVNAGAATSVTVTRDTSAVVASVNTFVKSFNDITKAIKDATAYIPATKETAVLNSEANVLAIQNQIRGALTTPLAGGSDALTLLSQVGVSIQKDGSLAVDSAKLQAATDKNVDAIAGLFGAVSKSSNTLTTVTGTNEKTQPGNYDINISAIATRGGVVGHTAASLDIANSNNSLTVDIDGVASTINISAGTYASVADLAKEIQTKINSSTAFLSTGRSVSVSENGGVLNLTSNTFGSSSRASIIGGTGRVNLGLDAGSTNTTGTNIVGTINGQPADGVGRNLTARAGNKAEGLSVTIEGEQLGARGTIFFTQGYASRLGKLVDSYLGTDGLIASRTDGISSSMKSIAARKVELTARLNTTEKRYRAQFSALDGVISSMSKTSSFLAQQLASLPRNN